MPRGGREVKMATKAKLLGERIRDNEKTEKVVEFAQTGAKAASEGCGFAAHLFGKLLRPVKARVKKAWDEYQAEYAE